MKNKKNVAQAQCAGYSHTDLSNFQRHFLIPIQDNWAADLLEADF
jgi:hypothetical protein